MIKNKKIYAIIPARGGSKGIPKKNIIDFNGYPLIYHSINFAKQSKLVDEVIVSTDSHEIKKIAEGYNSIIVDRPENISRDDSSTELAIKHIINEFNIHSDSIIVLLQPTSPIRPIGVLDKMLVDFINENFDSMVSISPCHPLNWKLKSDELICQYDYKNRPMRQQFKKDDFIYDENGSVYIFNPKLITKNNNRLGGKIGYEIFPEEYGRQIDTFLDLEILRATAKYLNKKESNV
tara:strand:+ start:1021 stop:1725 length:705 start_codon:yes stop_codon:yes gene_type:complete